MKKYVVTLFIGLNILYGYSQNIISGTITNTSNTPLSNVQVYVEHLKKGTLTNENGYFELKNIPNSTLKITAQFIGYNTQNKTVTINKINTVINFTLKETVYRMDEVVISTPFNKLQSENAIKVELINAKEIESGGNISLIKSIASIPGVDMISKGTGISQPVIRGLSKTNVLMLNNGVKMENFQFSSGHPYIIDEFGIDHVEIIKGPASLLYGSDAIGGVINLIKERPAPEGKIIGDFNTQYFSNTEGYAANLGVKGSSNNLNWGIRSSYKSHEDYEDGNGDFVPNTRFNEFGLKTNIGLKKSYGVFNLFYDYNQPNLGICVSNSIALIDHKGRDLEYWYQDLSNHLIASKNTLFLNNYKVDVNFAYQMNNRKLQTDYSTPAFEMVDMDLNTLSYEIKTHFPSTEKSEYLIGFQGANKTNRNNEAPNHVIPNADVNNYSIFGFAQYNISNKFKPQFGLRYDYKEISTEEETNKEAINQKFNDFSGSVGATYAVTDFLLLRSNLASAYRTPNIAELTQNGYHNGRYEVGNPDLVSQRSYEADLSAHLNLDKFLIDVSGFYNKINDYIFISPSDETTSNGSIIYYYNQTNAKIYGSELLVNYQAYKWLNLNLSYNFLVGKQNDDSYLTYIPQNKLRANIEISKTKLGILSNLYFKTGILVAEDQNHPSIYETKTSGYTLINLGFGANIKSINVSLQANNLFNKTYVDHLSTLKDLGYNDIGRNITATIKIPFTLK